jgi:hypothetical protein
MNKLISVQVPNQIKNGWEDSPIKILANQSGQFKSKFGTEIVKSFFEEKGISFSTDKNENVIFNGTCVSEIRTSFASIQKNTKTFWFNQIRPKVDNWTHLHLVCVHPDKIEVYEYSKEECLELCKGAPGLDHVGQKGNLLAIKVLQNKQSGNYWKLDCYGKFIGSIPTNQINLVNE